MVDSYIPAALPHITKGSEVILLKGSLPATPLTGKKVEVSDGGLSITSNSEHGPLYSGSVVSDAQTISISNLPVSICVTPEHPKKCVYDSNPSHLISPFCKEHMAEFTRKWVVCKHESCWNRIPIGENYCAQHGGKDWVDEQVEAVKDKAKQNVVNEKTSEVVNKSVTESANPEPQKVVSATTPVTDKKVENIVANTVDKQALATKDIKQQEEKPQQVSIPVPVPVKVNTGDTQMKQESEFCTCEDHEEEETELDVSEVKGFAKAKLDSKKSALKEESKVQSKGFTKKEPEKEATMIDKLIAAGTTELELAQEANVREMARQFKSLFAESLVGAISSDDDDDALRNRISKFLESPIGDFLLSQGIHKLMGMVPEEIPGGEFAAQIRKEVGIQGYQDAEHKALELIMGPLRQVIRSSLKGKGKKKVDFNLMPDEPVAQKNDNVEHAEYETVDASTATTSTKASSNR